MKRTAILSVLLAVFLWAGTAMAIPTTASVMDGVFDRDSEWAGYYADDNGVGSNGYVGPGYGGQEYDVEYLGLYITADEVFFGLQAGYPLWYKSGPGDLALDVSDDGTYDYAIRFSVNGAYNTSTASTASTASFDLWEVTQWTNGTYPDFYPIAAPYRMADGTQVGGPFTGGFGIVTDDVDGGHSYVLEGSFPRNLLGSDQGDVMAIHWTMYCGNDFLNEKATAPPVPEPATMLLLGVGLSGLGFLKRKKLFRHA